MIESFAREYRGWTIWDWSGWKADARNDFLAAQWLARKGEGKTERFLYSSTPGTAAEYRPGETFDTDLRPSQDFIHKSSPADEKSRQQALAYENLVRLIEEIETKPPR